MWISARRMKKVFTIPFVVALRLNYFFLLFIFWKILPRYACGKTSSRLRCPSSNPFRGHYVGSWARHLNVTGDNLSMDNCPIRGGGTSRKTPCRFMAARTDGPENFAFMSLSLGTPTLRFRRIFFFFFFLKNKIFLKKN